MARIDHTRSLGQAIGGAGLIAAPALGLAEAILAPQFTGGMEQELAHIAANPNRWLISNLLVLLTFALFTPAVYGMLRLLQGRARIAGVIGAGLIVLGAYFHGAVIGYATVELPLVEFGDDRAQALAFAERMYEHQAFTAILMPFLAFYLGLVVMAIALWRGRAAPLWVAALIVAAIAAEFFGPEAASPELMWVLFLVSFGWLGLKVLRTPDAQRDYAGSDAQATPPVASQSA